MKRKHFLTILLASFFVVMVFSGTDVFASISGDDACGSVGDKCGIDDFKKIFQGVFSLIISLGTPLLVIFVIYRFVMAWYALNQGNANAYKEATQKAGQAVLGFLVVVAIMGGLFLSILRFFGVQDSMLKLLKELTVVVVPHAYAAEPYPKGACPSKPEGYSCITDSGSTGFCVDGGYVGVCQNLVTSSVVVPKGNCGGGRYGTGLSCIADDGTNGACFSDRCVKLLGNPPTPAKTTDFNTYTCPDGTKAEKPALCPIVCGEKNVGASCTDAYGKAGKCSYNKEYSNYFCLSDGVVMCPEGKMYVNGNTCVDDKEAWADTTAATQRMNESTAGQINNQKSSAQAPTPAQPSSQAPVSGGGSGLPNPVGVTSLYDFILAALALVMRFFIYPALIFMWVWSGFLYVWAQGAPEKLAKAHKLVLWAFVSTLIVFVTQGFLSALRGSVQKILPKTSNEIRVEREPITTLINH